MSGRMSSVKKKKKMVIMTGIRLQLALLAPSPSSLQANEFITMAIQKGILRPADWIGRGRSAWVRQAI